MIQADIECAVRSDANVLISGGNATARTELARLIHERGSGRQRSMVVLGGGWRTGQGAADAEAASGCDAGGGTLFIEEITVLDGDAQHALMRLLDASAEFACDRARETRIISGTAHDLRGAMAPSWFSEELFYRLNVIHIALGGERRATRPWRVH